LGWRQRRDQITNRARSGLAPGKGDVIRYPHRSGRTPIGVNLRETNEHFSPERGPDLSPSLLRYATARPRLGASIVGQLGRDVGLAESGLPRVKRDALLTPRAPGRGMAGTRLWLTLEGRCLQRPRAAGSPSSIFRVYSRLAGIRLGRSLVPTRSLALRSLARPAHPHPWSNSPRNFSRLFACFAGQIAEGV
jgi:hypothetical protein